MVLHDQARTDYRVIVAGYDEMPSILELSSRLFDESNYRTRTTYSPNKLRQKLFMSWARRPQDFITFMLFCGDQPAGYAHVQRDDVFTEESIGELYQFYIAPEHRGSGGARLLRDFVDRQFDEWNCVIRYVECGVGIDEEKNNKQFFNLWAKIGYKFLGTLSFKEA